MKGLLQDSYLLAQLDQNPERVTTQYKQSGQPAKYQDQFEDAFRQSMADREANIELLKGKLSSEEGRELDWLQSANLRPALAFADSLTGGNSAAYYQPPTAAKDKADTIKRLQDAVAKEQGALSDDQLGYLKQRANEEALVKRENLADRRIKDSLDKQATNNEFKLRGEWDGDPITKNSKTIAEGWEKVNQSYSKGTKAGDLSLIYGLMKLQDPASVVRESEAAMAQAIGGFPAKTQAMWSSLTGKGKLTPEQRREIVEEAKIIREAQMARQKAVDDKYSSLATDYGFAPNRVVLSEIFKDGASTPSAPSGIMSPQEWLKSQGR